LRKKIIHITTLPNLHVLEYNFKRPESTRVSLLYCSVVIGTTDYIMKTDCALRCKQKLADKDSIKISGEISVTMSTDTGYRSFNEY